MLTRKWIGALASLLAIAGLVIIGGTTFTGVAAGSQAAPGAMVTPGQPQPPRQEIQRETGSTAISFDSPAPTCYRPIAGTGECYLQWNYLYATASSPEYMISMTVSIDGRLRAYYSGFFQTSMFVAGDMSDPGFKVTCGLPGAGGVFGMGHTHSYTISAKSTGSLSTPNHGFVTCPADVVHVFAPSVRRR